MKRVARSCLVPCKEKKLSLWLERLGFGQLASVSDQKLLLNDYAKALFGGILVIRLQIAFNLKKIIENWRNGLMIYFFFYLYYISLYIKVYISTCVRTLQLPPLFLIRNLFFAIKQSFLQFLRMPTTHKRNSLKDIAKADVGYFLKTLRPVAHHVPVFSSQIRRYFRI